MAFRAEPCGKTSPKVETRRELTELINALFSQRAHVIKGYRYRLSVMLATRDDSDKSIWVRVLN